MKNRFADAWYIQQGARAIRVALRGAWPKRATQQWQTHRARMVFALILPCA